MNIVNWLVGLFLAVVALTGLLLIGGTVRPLNARDLRRPWVLSRLEEIRLGVAMVVAAVIDPPPAYADSGLGLALGEPDPHRLVIDPDPTEAGEEEATEELPEEPAPAPAVVQEEPVLFYSIGPVPEAPAWALHSGMTGTFPILDADTLAAMDAYRAELAKAA
jgi:hypothetical protein